MNWLKSLKKIRVKFNEPLKNKTTLKTGGAAKVFVQPKDKGELREVVKAAKKDSLPILVLGGGSNILIDDDGVNAAVISLDRPIFRKIYKNGSFIAAGSGARLAQLIHKTSLWGLSGLEFLAGVPGTVGGALTMNAGAWSKQIGDLVKDVTVMGHNGKVKRLSRKSIKFKYRGSNLKEYIILGASFRLSKKNRKQIREDISGYLKRRRDTQDTSFPNAGCFFKNSAGRSAGKLMDLCGLRGFRIGGVSISDKHANFILNENNASSKDILRLMELAQRKVKQKFNIKLQPEVKIWR